MCSSYVARHNYYYFSWKSNLRNKSLKKFSIVFVFLFLKLNSQQEILPTKKFCAVIAKITGLNKLLKSYLNGILL